ncbi:hypothetical protein A9X79_11930 [Brachyspira hyodysenteriae]|nr:hypothetical protein A9X79_11930 [Brachyspira hyodysenteriae]
MQGWIVYAVEQVLYKSRLGVAWRRSFRVDRFWVGNKINFQKNYFCVSICLWVRFYISGLAF